MSDEQRAALEAQQEQAQQEQAQEPEKVEGGAEEGSAADDTDSGEGNTQEEKIEQLPTNFDYEGDTPLQTSINIFTAQSGVTEDNLVEAITDALAKQDGNLVKLDDELLAKLTPDQAAQATALCKAMYKEAEAERTRIQNVVYDIAGGKEQWETTVQAFNTNAPEHIQLAAKSMEQAGNVQAAVKFIIEQAKALGVVSSGTGIVKGSGGTPTVTALSPKEFQKEFGALQRQAGNRLFTSTEFKAKYEDLIARRNAFKG